MVLLVDGAKGEPSPPRRTLPPSGPLALGFNRGETFIQQGTVKAEESLIKAFLPRNPDGARLFWG
jgi:hypothetical protein